MATPKKKPEDLLKVGRKTLYDPSLCAKVEKLMREDGYTMTGAAGMLGFSYEAFNDWSHKHPEFKQAIKQGRAGRIAKLEREIMQLGGSKDGPMITARIFALKCAQSEEWRERQEGQDVNVKLGGDIKITIVDPKK